MRKSVFHYFKKSMAFFDIKAKSIPPVVFVIILALYLLVLFFTQTDTDTLDMFAMQFGVESKPAEQTQLLYLTMFVGILFQIPINIVSYIYLSAAIMDAKNVDYNANSCIDAVKKSIFKLAAITIIKNVAVMLFSLLSVGVFIFLIPALYLFVMTIFTECSVLDGTSRTALSSFKFSAAITKRRRGEIFFVVLFCNLLLFAFVLLLLLVFSTSNSIVYAYILIFILSLCTLIEHKLIAHLYVDALESYKYLNSGKNGGKDGEPEGEKIDGEPTGVATDNGENGGEPTGGAMDNGENGGGPNDGGQDGGATDNGENCGEPTGVGPDDGGESDRRDGWLR